MKPYNGIIYNDFIGRHTLLYGETNTKKTFYTAKFVQFLIESKDFSPKEISILDFAPNFKYVDNIKFGGKIEDYYKNSIECNNIKFEGEIIPPRLTANNKKELYEYACQNYKKTNDILVRYNEKPTSVLIINDVSIYLHLGNNRFLLKTIDKATTFLGNSYYGKSIKKDFASLFSLSEKRKIEHLVQEFKYAYGTE